MSSLGDKRRLKEELLRQYQQQQQMNNYRKQQKKYNPLDTIDSINNASKNVDSMGKGLSDIGSRLSESSNSRLASAGGKLNSLGDKMQGLSGQAQINSLKSGIMNSLGLNNAASSGSKLLSGGVQSAGTAAGTTAGTTAGSTGAALGSSLGSGAATGAAGTAAGAAGTAGATGLAAAGAAAIPVIGWAAAAAMLYKAIKDKKNAEAVPVAQQAAAAGMQSAMQQRAANQNTFANNAQNQIANVLPQQSNPNFEGMTGAAANITDTGELSAIPYEGGAQQALDEQKRSIFDDVKSGILGNAGNIGGNFLSGLKDFNTGYQDNVNSSFTDGDLYKTITGQTETSPGKTDDGAITGGASEVQKGFMQRLGEAAGTGQRMLSNPAVQGLIAGIGYGVDGSSPLYGLRKGVEWAQNKGKSNYYGRVLDENYRPNIIDNFNVDDYKAHTLNQYRDTMANRNNMTAHDFYTMQRDLGYLSDDEYNAIVTSKDYKPDKMINLTGYKNMSDAYKKERETDGRLNRWDNQNRNDARRLDIQEAHYKNSDAASASRAAAYERSVQNQIDRNEAYIQNLNQTAAKRRMDVLKAKYEQEMLAAENETNMKERTRLMNAANENYKNGLDRVISDIDNYNPTEYGTPADGGRLF